MMSSRFACSSAVALSLLATGLSASAALVTTDFTGIVTSNNPNNGTPLIGFSLIGSFTIDPSVTTGDGPLCVATANCWSAVGTSVTWEGVTRAAPDPIAVVIGITDSAAGAGADKYEVTMTNVGTGFLATAKLTLIDPTGTAFEAAANPLFPAFGSFASGTFSYVPLCITGTCFFSNRFYAGDLRSLGVAQAVPEPAAVGMLMLGLTALAARKRQHKPKA